MFVKTVNNLRNLFPKICWTFFTEKSTETPESPKIDTDVVHMMPQHIPCEFTTSSMNSTGNQFLHIFNLRLIIVLFKAPFLSVFCFFFSDMPKKTPFLVKICQKKTLFWQILRTFVAKSKRFPSCFEKTPKKNHGKYRKSIFVHIFYLRLIIDAFFC